MLLLCVLNVTTRILSSQIYVSHGLILCALHIDPWEFLNKVDTTTTTTSSKYYLENRTDMVYSTGNFDL
mgnify:CR=1 FL=1